MSDFRTMGPLRHRLMTTIYISHGMWSGKSVILVGCLAFYFLPLLACYLVGFCFSVVYCCTHSFVSGHIVCVWGGGGCVGGCVCVCGFCK